jgi:hypothetical protein
MGRLGEGRRGPGKAAGMGERGPGDLSRDMLEHLNT